MSDLKKLENLVKNFDSENLENYGELTELLHTIAKSDNEMDIRKAFKIIDKKDDLYRTLCIGIILYLRKH